MIAIWRVICELCSWILQSPLSSHFCGGHFEFFVYLWHREHYSNYNLGWSSLCGHNWHCLVKLLPVTRHCYFIFFLCIIYILKAQNVIWVQIAALISFHRSSDARYLASSSQDGYCTLLEFDGDELGTPIVLSGLHPFHIQIAIKFSLLSYLFTICFLFGNFFFALL